MAAGNPSGFTLCAFLKVAGGGTEGPTAFSKVSLDLLLYSCSPSGVGNTAVRKVVCLSRSSLKASCTLRNKKAEISEEWWWSREGEVATHTSVMAILMFAVVFLELMVASSNP